MTEKKSLLSALLANVAEVKVHKSFGEAFKEIAGDLERHHYDTVAKLKKKAADGSNRRKGHHHTRNTP